MSQTASSSKQQKYDTGVARVDTLTHNHLR